MPGRVESERRQLSRVLGTGGAVIALSVAAQSFESAHAMSELEELLGEPVEALSEDQLDEVRGGFISFDGVQFNFAVDVSTVVDGTIVRSATLVADTLASNAVLRPDEAGVPLEPQVVAQELTMTPETADEMLDGVRLEQSSTTDATTVVVGSAGSSAAPSSAPAPSASATPAASLGGPAVLDGLGAVAALTNIAAIVDGNNRNVALNTTLTVDVGNFTAINAAAVSGRIESALSGLVAAQIVTNLFTTSF